MTQLRAALIVAGWEFRRYYKWKDQLFGFISFLAVGALWVGATAVARAKGGTVSVAAVGILPDTQPGGRVRFVAAPETDSARLAALRDGDVAGVLTRRPDGTFDLLVAKDPRYRGELAAILNDAVRRERLAGSGMSPEGLARTLAPARLDVRFVDPARQRRGTAELIAASLFIVIMLLAAFTSMAYILTGISGEKQLRVTESVVSAIAPQAWIDGKVLGLAGYALVSIGSLVAGGLVTSLAAQLAIGFQLPDAAVRPGVIVTLTLFCGLGLLLWNSFFAALASTMDDPNTSSRGSLVLLPVLPVVASLAVLRDPDGIVARTLALFPLTSAPALPMRLVLSDPGPLEIAASAVLLAGAIWLMRRLAGRIFEVGMLMYGKEPTLREVIRWARD